MIAGVEHLGFHPLTAIAPALRVWIALHAAMYGSPLFSLLILDWTASPVRMLALDVSSAANQETI
jgi:hypothetical protein